MSYTLYFRTKTTAITFREAAKSSISSNMIAQSLELKHIFKLIRELDSEIDEIASEIKAIIDKIISMLRIPWIRYRMGAMSIAEIDDSNRFDSADKLLAYAGLSPSTYQSWQLEKIHPWIKKRGSRYLRYTIHYLTPTPMFAAGIQHLTHTLPKANWRKALLCCCISRHQETCVPNMPTLKNQTAIQKSCLI